MSEGHVRFSASGRVGHILIDHPEARNAMSPAMYAELEAICADIGRDQALRAVVLRGAGGKAFVAGSDIAQFLDFISGEDGVAYETRMDRAMSAVTNMPLPTLAVVEGFAVGGGLGIASSCDLRIAATGSRFGSPIARTLGNCMSARSYARMLSCFGEGRARRMLLLGELLEAEEALACGFLARLVPREALDATIAEITDRLVANSPLSMLASKTALNRLVAAGVSEDEAMLRRIYGSEDFRNAARAFLDKRRYDWTGQ
jgi:enoyl-CoA hydratase/carnithine racemase